MGTLRAFVECKKGETYLLHQGILLYKTNTGALHDQQGRPEQMGGHTHEDRSSDNTARTILDKKKHVLFWVYLF
jgi:hypothetical protein